MTTGYLHVLGYWVKYETTHEDPCPWCAAARDVAQGHMRDASYKTTKYTRTDSRDEKHTAYMERMGRGMRPIITKGSGVSGPVTITVPGVLTYQDPRESHYSVRMSGAPFGSTLGMGMPAGTYTLQTDEPKPAIDMSDKGLNRYADTATANEAKLITEVMNLRNKLSRQRDVVLDMTEAEAATVLELLDNEQENQTDEADRYYQNGDGYESECVQARTLARDAEKIGDRLRGLLGKRLDNAYSGEADE